MNIHDCLNPISELHFLANESEWHRCARRIAKEGEKCRYSAEQKQGIENIVKRGGDRSKDEVERVKVRSYFTLDIHLRMAPMRIC